MPYVPRSIAPLTGLAVDFNTVPKAQSQPTSKATVPYRPTRTEASRSGVKKSNPLNGKLSLKDWDVDPLKVMKQILGKEYKADEHSGLVSHS
jgi:hypothetical protein